MQPERIILIPPTHEQESPSFHIEESLAPDFQAFLKSHHIEFKEPPTKLEKQGPDQKPLVEVEVEPNTDQTLLEGLIREFLHQHDG